MDPLGISSAIKELDADTAKEMQQFFSIAATFVANTLAQLGEYKITITLERKQTP